MSRSFIWQSCSNRDQRPETWNSELVQKAANRFSGASKTEGHGNKPGCEPPLPAKPGRASRIRRSPMLGGVSTGAQHACTTLWGPTRVQAPLILHLSSYWPITTRCSGPQVLASLTTEISDEQCTSIRDVHADKIMLPLRPSCTQE